MFDAVQFWRLIFCFFCAISSCLYSHCLVYVHLGPNLPVHLPHSIAQARLFNPDCPIYVIAEPTACATASLPGDWNVQFVPTSSLERSQEHEVFCLRVPSGDDLYRLAKERFYYLEEFVRKKDLKDVFHIENDVMIYLNFEEKLELFRKLYPNMIAVPFNDETQSVPCFLYIYDKAPLTEMVSFLCSKAHERTPDMELISQFKDANYQTRCDHLPIMMPKYLDRRPLMNLYGHCPPYTTPFFNHIEEFQMVFDAAAIGQFLGGLDPHYHQSGWQGFLNHRCVFNMSFCDVEWRKDACDRYIPYIGCGEKFLPVGNLHIHSKQLQLFFSKNESMPAIPTPRNPLDHYE